MEAIGILILIAIAIFCAWVLTMVRRSKQAAKDDDVEEEEEPKAELAPEPEPESDSLAIVPGKTLWLLTNTASYGTEVNVIAFAKINGRISVNAVDKRGRRYWVKPEQLSPFSPRELYGKYQFDAIVYWPGTPYHGREVSIRDYNEDYLFTECALMLTHAMIRFPRHKFPIMRIEDTTSTPTNTNEQES